MDSRKSFIFTTSSLPAEVPEVIGEAAGYATLHPLRVQRKGQGADCKRGGLYLNYIDLQRLKDTDIKNITFEQDIQDHVAIAPMLLIPFIENSFKHSRIEDTEKGWIEIKLRCHKQEIFLSCANSIPAVKYRKDKTGGIGKENTRRRDRS